MDKHQHRALQDEVSIVDLETVMQSGLRKMTFLGLEDFERLFMDAFEEEKYRMSEMFRP